MAPDDPLLEARAGLGFQLPQRLLSAERTRTEQRRFKDTWGGDDAESVEKVHAFFETRFFEQMAPIAGAREALAQLSERFRFVVVTSRQHVIRESTLAWLQTHFPGVFHDVLFGNHWCAGRNTPTGMHIRSIPPLSHVWPHGKQPSVWCQLERAVAVQSRERARRERAHRVQPIIHEYEHA
jgi:hypothetical protein